jgi:hypothetical protein
MVLLSTIPVPVLSANLALYQVMWILSAFIRQIAAFLVKAGGEGLFYDSFTRNIRKFTSLHSKIY